MEKDSTKIKFGEVSRESLSGSPAREVHAEVSSVSRETLHGTPARTVHAEISSVGLEKLVKGPGVYSIEVLRDTLVHAPDEPTSSERITTYVAQMSSGKRGTLDASQVKSWIQTKSVNALQSQSAHYGWAQSPIDVVTNVALVTGQVVSNWPTSPIDYHALRALTASGRTTLRPDHLRSDTQLATNRALVALSRNRKYVPVSAVYAKTGVSLVAAAKDLSPVKSQVSTSGYVSLIAQARIAIIDSASAYSATFVQSVAVGRSDKTPISAIDVASQAAVVAAKRRTPKPFADSDVAQVVTQVSFERLAVNPKSQLIAGQVVTQVSFERLAVNPKSQLIAGQVLTVASIPREVPAKQISQAIVSGSLTLVSTARKTEPFRGFQSSALASLAASMRPDNAFPLSQAIVTLSIQQSVTSKTTPAIGDVWSASPVAQAYSQAVLGRYTLRPDLVTDPTTGRHVQIVKVQYALGRTTTKPKDVYDPETGRLTRGLFNLTSIERKLELLVDRTVYSLTEPVILGDSTFPPQSAVTINSVFTESALADISFDHDTPGSEVSITEGHAIAALGDSSIASVGPKSDVSVEEANSTIALGDKTLPGPDEPLSDVEVTSVFGHEVLADSTYPDTNQALSALEVGGLSGGIALGDASLPDANTPLSEAVVESMSQGAVLSDNSMVGISVFSAAIVNNVVRAVVLSDPDMRSLPSRPAGPRPVISIAIY